MSTKHPIGHFTKEWLNKGDDDDLVHITQGLFQTAGMHKMGQSKPGTETGYGEAIDVSRAAHCTVGRERTRTGAFIRGLYQEVLTARREKPNEPVRIAELGCGPLAPIALSVASQFTPDEVRLSLIDMHDEAVQILSELIQNLGLSDHIDQIKTGNLLEGDWSYLNPDLIVLEVMMPGLLYEPQGAVTAYLAPQFPNAIWLPDSIRVSGHLTHGYTTPRDRRIPLGQITAIDENFRSQAKAGTPLEELIQVKRDILLHKPLKESQHLMLRTRVEVRPGIKIAPPSKLVEEIGHRNETMGRAQEGHSRIHIQYRMGADQVDFHSTAS